MSQAPEFVSTEPCPVHLIETSPASTTTKPLDDPRLQQIFGDAIEGALALGFQNSNPPPPGHWLQRFWNIGRSEASRVAPAAIAEEVIDTWMHVPTLKLRAGEMSAQEVRSVVGVLSAVKDNIGRLSALRATPPQAACDAPPAGWRCTRAQGHEGPCAATPATEGSPA
jgi:hypothetical protein